MPASLLDYVKAGAIQSLVNYWNDRGGRDSDWAQVTLFAYREFRDAPAEVIPRLISMAKAAHLAAVQHSAMKPGECLTKDCIPNADNF